MEICALIMAGGKGTRFWPLSTDEKPKQFLNLVGDKTMIQMTVDRILPIIPIEKIFICTLERYVNVVKEQLPNIPKENIIIEPEGRNTAPCIALSALMIKRYYNNVNMLVLPADHLIKDEGEFRNIVKSANKFIENNNNAIITLGMNPSRLETGYGYIKCGVNEENIQGYEVLKVESFVEKPNVESAKRYIEDGSYLWNGGIFFWSVENILGKIKSHCTETYEALSQIENVPYDKLQDLINENYNKTKSISIDYAVLEKDNDIYVIPSDFGWDDIGSWKAVERYKEKDKNDNIISENSIMIKSTSNMVVNNKKKIVMIGVNNMISIEMDDIIYIVNKDYLDDLQDYHTDLIDEGIIK